MPELTLLFTSAFLAATLLPFPSEVTLAGLLHAGQSDRAALWLVATIGNTLGSLVNWVIGRLALRFEGRPWFPLRRDRLGRAQPGSTATASGPCCSAGCRSSATHWPSSPA